MIIFPLSNKFPTSFPQTIPQYPITFPHNSVAYPQLLHSELPLFHTSTPVCGKLSIPAAGAGEVTNLGIGFAGKIYMQDVNSTVCNSVSIGTEGRLIDNRDNKVYWVGRLKDGLCWMTQNLAYDGGGTKVDTINFPSDTTARYYNPGAYAYSSDPIKQNACTNNSTGLSACTGNGWKKIDDYSLKAPEDTWTMTDVSSFYGATSYIATDGITICNKQANSYFGDMTSSYIPCRIYSEDYLKDEDLHYLAGNYYNYNAATNGTGPSSGNATGSVCPANWSLPTSNNTSTGSFGGLTSGLVASTTATANNLKLAPYYFVYGGYVGSSSLYTAGSYGYYWSSTAYDGSRAYNLYFTTSVSPSYDNGRYVGYSVRCVAK